MHLPCPADSPGQETTPCRSGSPADGSDRCNVSMLAKRRANGFAGSSGSPLSCTACDAEPVVIAQTRQRDGFLLLSQPKSYTRTCERQKTTNKKITTTVNNKQIHKLYSAASCQPERQVNSHRVKGPQSQLRLVRQHAVIL